MCSCFRTKLMITPITKVQLTNTCSCSLHIIMSSISFNFNWNWEALLDTMQEIAIIFFNNCSFQATSYMWFCNWAAFPGASLRHYSSLYCHYTLSIFNKITAGWVGEPWENTLMTICKWILSFVVLSDRRDTRALFCGHKNSKLSWCFSGWFKI